MTILKITFFAAIYVAIGGLMCCIWEVDGDEDE